MVSWLIQEMLEIGKTPCIITRGYNRQSKKDIIIDQNKKYTVNEIGDEPWQLLNIYPNIEMIVSNNKINAINIASNNNKIDVVILDDGFQSLYIKRDLDIVMINQKSLVNNFYMFPYGDARENQRALNRADCVIYTKGSVYNNIKNDKNLIIWECKKNNIPEFEALESYFLDDSSGEKILNNKNMISICGIGDAESFVIALDLMKVNRIKDIKYNDHFIYTINEGHILLKEIQSFGCDSIITTEKDYEKIRLLKLKNINIIILKMNFVIKEKNELMTLIKNKIFHEN